MKRAFRAVLAVALASSALGIAPPAQAQWWLISEPTITDLVIEEEQSVAQLRSILAALQSQSNLIVQLLKGQPGGELGLVAGLLDTTNATYASLLGNLQTIGYTIASVNANYTPTFPSTGAYGAMPQTQFPTVEGAWQNEILASSEVAARSQASISDTQALTEAAAEILKYVGATDSEVGQLQLIAQMLGVVQSQMTMLVQNLATTGRAMVESGAASASERQLSSERKRRNRLNYTSRGAAVNVPSTMP